MNQLLALITFVPVFLAGYFFKSWSAVLPVLLACALWSHFVVAPRFNYRDRILVLDLAPNSQATSVGITFFFVGVFVMFFIGQAARSMMDR